MPALHTERTSALAFSTSVPLPNIKVVEGRGPTQVIAIYLALRNIR